ncbi:hypothetical protein MXB_1636 [Myxobolus squamalis]|nr:hypothetical protein MXB_1636 [Myxobolus squamalis]
MDDGVLHVIELGENDFTTPKYIPPSTFDDTKGRILWRSRHNLHLSFLYTYLSGFAKYILHLEDDVIANIDYLKTIQKHIKSCRDVIWYQLRFSNYYGDIGILFPAYFLEHMAKLHRALYLELPCDMLRNRIIERAFKNELSNPPWVLGCPRMKLRSSLFKHIGTISSLDKSNLSK